MLRIHFMRQGFYLNDPAMDDAPHDVPLFRDFAALGGWDDRLSDESTILRLRDLLEKHKLVPEVWGPSCWSCHALSSVRPAQGFASGDKQAHRARWPESHHQRCGSPQRGK